MSQFPTAAAIVQRFTVELRTKGVVLYHLNMNRAIGLKFAGNVS